MNEAPAGRPAVAQLLDAVTLPCGAEIDPLLEQVADGRAADQDAHQRPACTARPPSQSSPPSGRRWPKLVPGVCVALGRSTDSKTAALTERVTFKHRHPRAAAGVLGRTAVIDLAVAVTCADPVHQVARDIQQNVITALRDQLGLNTVKVNVNVDDIVIDEDQ